MVDKTNMTRQLRKAQQASQVRPRGQELLQALISEPTLSEMIESAEKGLPPLAVVAEKVAREFPELLASSGGRQFVGVAIAAAMAQRGYFATHERARVRRGGFTLSALYRRKEVGVAQAEEPLALMIRALKRDHARLVLTLLREHFPEIF